MKVYLKMLELIQKVTLPSQERDELVVKLFELIHQAGQVRGIAKVNTRLFDKEKK